MLPSSSPAKALDRGGAWRGGADLRQLRSVTENDSDQQTVRWRVGERDDHISTFDLLECHPTQRQPCHGRAGGQHGRHWAARRGGLPGTGDQNDGLADEVARCHNPTDRTSPVEVAQPCSASGYSLDRGDCRAGFGWSNGSRRSNPDDRRGRLGL